MATSNSDSPDSSKVSLMNNVKAALLLGFPLLPPIIGLVIGLLLLVNGFQDIHGAQASKTWPTVNGRILSSSVEAKRTVDRKGNYYTYYEPKLLYKYSVEDDRFTGSQIAYDGKYDDENRLTAESVVKREHPTF